MQVKNINGTSVSSCNCGSWLEHWEKYSGQPPPSSCPVKSCGDIPEVGALVQRDNSTDTKWYIIPLCKTHNGEKGESIEIGDYITLVSANVSETCGKR